MQTGATAGLTTGAKSGMCIKVLGGFEARYARSAT